MSGKMVPVLVKVIHGKKIQDTANYQTSEVDLFFTEATLGQQKF